MALISKIRRNFWLVLILLGMALASFVIMDILGSKSSGGLFNQTTVAEIDGQKIDYMEFQNTERALFSGGQDPYASRASLWEYLLSKVLVTKQAESLGLGVGKDELMDLQFGANPSPVIMNAFTNPQTGVLDREQLNQVRQAIETGQELNETFRFSWSEQEKQIQTLKIQDKITNLVTKAMYTPSFLVEVSNQFGSESADAAFVKVPFDAVSDADAALTDADYSAYLNENKKRYTNDEETRTIDYIAFDVVPSVEDSAAILERMTTLGEEFKTTTNDSLFVANNEGVLSTVYSKLEDFTGELKNQIGGLSKGEVAGPFIETNSYVLLKLVDSRVIADSVKARHILKSTETQSLESARMAIDSLRQLLVSGKESFDSLAIKNSDDPGSGYNGGDLGTFAQGRMVKQFNDACFINSTEGGLYTVTTQFGVHLIQVEKIIFNDREPKYMAALISQPIIPSEKTQEAVFDEANKLLTENRTLAALEEKLKASDELSISTSRPLEKNDYFFQELGGGESSRSMIKWAFTAKPGEVSPTIYDYNDNVNYFTKTYVIAGLKEINPPGLMSVENAKLNIESLVKNKKKGEILKTKINATSGLSAVAGQFATDVDTSYNVTYAQGSAEFAGEPMVVAKVFGLDAGKVSSPVVGNTGVYVLQTIEKRPSIAINNMPYAKLAVTSAARSSVSYRLWDALKKQADITDNRSRFY